jgi:hypothetical protein
VLRRGYGEMPREVVPGRAAETARFDRLNQAASFCHEKFVLLVWLCHIEQTKSHL